MKTRLGNEIMRLEWSKSDKSLKALILGRRDAGLGQSGWSRLCDAEPMPTPDWEDAPQDPSLP